jgi:predicted ATPase/signal transduction histidine kinase
MMQHSGYRFEVLRSDGEFTLYRARRPGEPSILALTTTDQPSPPESIARLAHEYGFAAELDAAWAAQPIELARIDGRPMLLLRDCGGDPLDVLLERAKEQPIELTLFLALASNLAAALAQVHRRGLIHKDIKPSNVLVDVTGEVRITGFGMASHLRSERHSPRPPELISGTLAYMAPEQTGRMNRSIDARSDLYSLGVTLYELATGTLPFTASDPLELIHCHIAQQPVPPRERVDGLPATVSAILLKLLAKNPEDRYRTAAGVEADLRSCLTAWSSFGRIETFELAEHDVSDRLLIPEKLYGRGAEIDVLVRAFERVAATGTTELVLVSGYAGIGKSSIVNELRKALAPHRGLFAAGKFDQYNRDTPYASLAQAFQSLVRQLLSKGDTELAEWRDTLRAALGANGQLMVNLIPELGLVIGEQRPLAQVEPQSAQARFQLVFRSLLSVFAKPEQPLVLFIDDLQWLDTGTLQLLERSTLDRETRNILLIGAYRDTEVGPDHPLFTTLTALRRAGTGVSEVTLGALSVDDLAQLCADAMNTDIQRTYALAELLAEKTAGNPFFAVEFMKALAEDGLLRFDPESTLWQWDMGRIRAKAITDNVADLVSSRLNRLPLATREALGELACLGSIADIRTVALVRGSSEQRVPALYRDGIEAGLVLQINGSFAFAHDRVHEAAYALIPQSERAMAHLRIARLLLAHTPANELEQKVFQLVHQFDRGAAAIDAQTERERVADLYLIAGNLAKTSSAYGSAHGYFAAGRALLGDTAWKNRQQVTFELELHRAECEIVLGELTQAEQRLADLARHALGHAQQGEVVCLALLLFLTTGRSERAVEVALEFLSRVGIAWTTHPTEAEARDEYLRLRRNLAERPIRTLVDLPAMSDPECLTTMAVLTALFPVSHAVDRYLLELVLLRMANLSLENGNCASSTVAYSALNMVLGEHFSDYQTAYSLGQLACDLVDRGVDRFKARVYSCFGALTMPWIKHLPLCQPLIEVAFELSCSVGDLTFAAYSSRNLVTNLLVSGLPLDQVQREAERAIEFSGRVQLGLPAEQFIRQHALVEQLRGVSTRLTPDPEWATHTAEALEASPGLAMMTAYHWVYTLEERYFAGDFPAALAAAARVEGIRWAMRSTIEESEYDFYAALTRAAVSGRGTVEECVTHLRALSNHYRRIVVWAEHCPANFSNRKALIGAEVARLEGRALDAQRLYEEAVQLAHAHDFVQNEGLASELAAQFYASRGLETPAQAYLRNARACYVRWGAASKVNRLDSRHPQLRARSAPGLLTTRFDKPLAQLDVQTVDKASQTLSSEMVLPSLLEKLMRLAVEHAGAERGLLILVRDHEPYIEAEATTGHGRVAVAIRSVRATPADLPQSALQYVLRTHSRLVLDNASVGGLDPDDSYVSNGCPKSVLCLPIFKKTQVVGALYLENNLTTCAFTADRVAVLDFLASQAAISLENARLYSDLQRSEALLREAQHLSSTGSFYWRVALDTLEFSEQTFRTYELDPNAPLTLDAIATRIHPEDLSLFDEMVDIARGPATDLDYIYRAQMPDGTVKHLHLVAHGARDENGQLEYIGAIQDVTQRHVAEEALSKVRSELAHVARVTTLGALTASIAHEVSQPLSGIVTNSSTCLRMLGADPPNVEGAKETVRRTIRDGHRAAEVITRLRALFGNKESTSELVDLNETTREVITLSWNELQSGRVMLRTELAADLPRVIGDRVQLQQVILNLLLNAADAMREVDHARELVIKTEPHGCAEIKLSVKDSGVGFDPESVNQLFDPFYSTKSHGMGMGLSVSRSIIESHQGRLWAVRNEGPGATFSFSIPCLSSATDTRTPTLGRVRGPILMPRRRHVRNS